MARWGKCDFRELKALQKRMEKLSKAETEKFCEECARELAARLLGKVIRRTPVGRYRKGSGKNGGTLRRGWTVKSEREAELTAAFGGGDSVKKYVDSLRVVRSGNLYAIDIINPVSYASYVEYGHRTVDHKGWVIGRFMMTISADELQAQTERIIGKKLLTFLGEVF